MYASDAQRKLFHAKEERGEISAKTVHEFDKESKGKKLPEHVKKMAHGGYACMNCGGDVDAEGFAQGGEVETSAKEQTDEERKQKSRALLDAALALRGRR